MGTLPANGTPQERKDGLKRNCLDSIVHALAHFSANHSDDYGFHNQKWAILSVAHATEAFCNLLLLALDQGHPNQMKYPGLRKAINRLQNNGTPKLSCAERYAIKKVFPGLDARASASHGRWACWPRSASRQSGSGWAPPTRCSAPDRRTTGRRAPAARRTTPVRVLPAQSSLELHVAEEH